MNKKIKKFFLNLSGLTDLMTLIDLLKPPLIKAKRTFLFLMTKRNLWLGALLLFVALGLTFPLFLLQAQFGWLGGAGDLIGKAIGHIIAGFMLSIPTAVLGIASVILGWATDPSGFISDSSITYTSGGVVAIGWPVVRDLANMGIVLALVIIGLTTALRLEEYHARKTLPRLVVIALLINFTPVLLGVIVDFTNIVMNFFLEGLIGGKIVTSIFSDVSRMIASDAPNFFDSWELVGFVLKIILIGIFMSVAAVVFFLFAVLFIMRRVIIWMLVIMSPIAFVSYILPSTRGLWKMWWNQFIQWSIIGVYAAFFLWLGDHMIGIASRGDFVTEVPGNGPGISNIFNDVLPYGVALIFMLFGFFVALTTSAAGSAGVINLARRGTKAAGAAATGWAGTRTATLAKEKWQKSPGVERISRRMALAEKAPRLKPGWGRDEEGEAKKGLVAWGRRRAAETLGLATGAVTVPTWAVGRAVGRAGVAGREIGIPDVAEEKEEAKKRGVEMKASHLLSPEKTKTQRVATILAAREQNQLKPLEKLIGKERWGAVMEQLGREAMEIHPEVFKQFVRAYPTEGIGEVAEKFHEERREAAGMVLTDADRKAGYETAIQKVAAEMKTDDIAKMAPSSLSSEGTQEVIHKFWSGNQIAAAAREFGREFADSFQRKVGEKKLDWYLENNPKVPLYLASNGAQELGFNSLEGLGTAQVREQIRSWKTPDENIKKEIASRREKIDELRHPRGVLRRVPKEQEEQAREVEDEVADYEKLLERKRRIREAMETRETEARKARETKEPAEERTRGKWWGQGRGKY